MGVHNEMKFGGVYDEAQGEPPQTTIIQYTNILSRLVNSKSVLETLNLMQFTRHTCSYKLNCKSNN